MQLTIELDDNITKKIKKEFQTDDIKGFIENSIEKMIYKREYEIAREINQAIKDVKEGKTRDIQELFDEL